MNELTIKVISCFIIGIIVFLPILIASKWSKRRPPLPYREGCGVLYHSSFLTKLMGLGTVVFYAFVIMSVAAYEDTNMLYAIVLFLGFALFESAMVVYLILWRAVVEDGAIIIYSWGVREKKVKFYEITSIKEVKDAGTKDRLTAYIGRKMIFELDEDVIGFDFLYEKLQEAGKIQYTDIKESFVVARSKGDIARAVFGALFLDGMVVAILVLGVENLEFIYRVGLIFFAIIFTINLVNELLWRVTVTYSHIYIRNGCGMEKAYSLREITCVKQESARAMLFVGKKKIVMVGAGDNNYSVLLERLRNLDITFYKR